MTDLTVSPVSSPVQTPTVTAPSRGLLRTVTPWLIAVAAMLVLPFIFRSDTHLTVMSLMGIAIIFALSYNMMLGQTGMLSFGHAVYYGLGAYFAVHAINWAIATRAPIPLPLMPPRPDSIFGPADYVSFCALSAIRMALVFGKSYAMPMPGRDETA